MTGGQPPEPTTDLWEERARPILGYIAEHEADTDFVSIGDLAGALGMEPKHVTVEVERLVGGGYIAGELQKVMTGGDQRPWFLTEPRLTERGARAVSLWRRAENLLRVLDDRADREPDPEKRKLLRQIAGAARELGVSVVGEVLAAAAKRTVGIP